MHWTTRLSLFLFLSGLGGTVSATRQHVLAPQRVSKPAAPAFQLPRVYDAHSSYDSGLFTPFRDLSVLSSDSYSQLTHPFFPRHALRIKKSTFCDGTVNSYTGYIDVEARHLFFYFFESRHDPLTDDVIFWTNGGPGCSSAMGVFMELGPCRVVQQKGAYGEASDGIKLEHHPESWNENANVFFVDQPVGVGFSYAEHGESVSTTEEAAQDIAAFVGIFFEHFNQFKGRGFHMAGESYGGRYVPLFASAVYDQNARLVQAGLTPINLTSVMIGNGMTDFSTMLPSYYDMACTPASVPPLLDISTCVRMKRVVPRCEKWLKEACVDLFDDINCGAAISSCYSELASPFSQTGTNPYDISRPCDGDIDDTLCYPVTKAISSYLDRPAVRHQLGVDPALLGQNFSSCSQDVYGAFMNSMDEYHQTQHYVASLLDRGVKALIYVGAYDWICNWVGNERWTLALEWTGKNEFIKKELRAWSVDGKKAGSVRSAGPFTFATIDGAGHMVPYDKPTQALEMVKRWLAGVEL
ncbi:hypothetical protein APHAL10511_008671 [Amanita phalloides]|nr:hypothetical protein APHAL10511_008671 [Amanita phalloides]